jgi:hypothetical protein
MGNCIGWCPWWREVCNDGLTKTMLKATKRGEAPIKCSQWRKVSGKNPQSGADLDHWDCTFGWGPTLQLEQARVNFSLGGAVESLRNRINELGQGLNKVVQVLPYLVNKDIVQVQEIKKEQLEHKDNLDEHT